MRRIIHMLAAVVSVGLLGTLVTGAGFIRGNHGSDAQAAEQRPNFVVVLTDDLTNQNLTQLPGIQKLVGSHGVTFDNSYVTYALCCPSRASYLRGQYPHNHDITTCESGGGEPKFRDLGRDNQTVATWLDETGYQTMYLGKYLNGYKGPYVPPGWDQWYALQGDVDDNVVNDNGQSVQLSGNSTYAFADETSNFIRRSATNPQPFFVTVGTKAPHRPPEIPARYSDKFADTPLPRPPSFDEADVSDKPQWVQKYPRLTQDRINKEEDLYRERLRSMLPVRDLLQQVIATLRDTGELKNTYIIFTSDNGFHQGQHRLVGGDKKTAYEEDTRVPLMVRGPGVPTDAVRKGLVLNNDLAPTIADLAGASTSNFVDGTSFAPLLSSSPPSSWRTAFLEEGWQPPSPPIPTHKSAHTRNHVLTKYVTGEEELYDLDADPYQLNSKPRAGNKILYSRLEKRLDALRACSGGGCRQAEGFSTNP